MTRHPSPPFGLAHFSLLCVGLMWVLPFLYFYHAYPVTTFYQEWLAAWLAIAALPLLLTDRYWQAPEVPRMVLAPIGLMLVLLVQFLAGRVIHFDYVLLLALYFLGAALLMILGQRLREELGLEKVVQWLAIFLLAGALLNTLVGILQHFRWHTVLDSVITVKVSTAVYGNLAQPNHFAHYITLGLISLGLLSRRLRVWHTVLLAAPMLFVLVLSGSRSAWLYLVAALALAWWVQRRDASQKPLLYFSAALLAGFAVMHLVVQLPFLAGASGVVTSGERLFNESGGNSIRFFLWREALLIFTQFPLLGAGFGQFAWQHFELGPVLQNTDISGLYNNAHNVVMQIAAEAGLAGLLALLWPLLPWLSANLRGEPTLRAEHWWGYALLAVAAIHSLLEYPLWYQYFLGVAAVLLGLFDRTTYRLQLRAMGRLAVAAILLLGAVSLGQGALGYRHIERALAQRVQAAQDPQQWVSRTRDELLAAHGYPLFNSYAALFIANMVPPTADHLQEKLALNERALRFIPTAQLAYHQALLLGWADRPREAEAMLLRALWSYPADYETVRGELEQLAQQEPRRFAPLLEFATRKIEEYRRAAVSAR
ncbi:MAG: PglL family O-oligosaccharyltransferase [Sideroxydans sp.]